MPTDKRLAHTDDIYEDQPAKKSRVTMDLSPWLALLILVLLLAEIAERRLFLSEVLGRGYMASE